MVEIGTKLRECRKNKHLTQLDVANRIHISKAMLSSYELNIREPSLVTLMRLASIYNISIDSLLGLDKSDTISVKGLTDKQVSIVQSIIDSYREK